MQKSTGMIETHRKSIHYTFFKQESNTNTLAIVLPGAGYTTQHPLLHFTTGVFYRQGYDILHINYQYSKDELASLKEAEFTDDVQTVINNILMDYSYNNFYIVAKSIGTIAASYLLQTAPFNNAKVIWFTPLLQREDVYQALLQSPNKALCFIGSEDPYYHVERFQAIEKNSQLKPLLIEGVNHSLEFDKEIIASIQVLQNIIEDIDVFLTSE